MFPANYVNNSAGGGLMQGDQGKRPENGKFCQVRAYFRTRSFRSNVKGLVIILGCMILFSAGILFGLRTSFKGTPPSGTDAPDLGVFIPSEPGHVEQGASEQDLTGDEGVQGPGGGEAGLEREPLTEPSSQPEAIDAPEIAGPSEETQSDSQVIASLDHEPLLLDGMVLPTSGQIIKRPGWFYSEELGDWRYYPGVAISTTPGVEVKAVGTGVIKRIYQDEALGLVIVIDHGDRYESRYAGVSSSGLVPGQQVSKGQTIGRTEGDVLHFELLGNGEAMDPAEFLGDGN
jgi:hypothetical protein